MCFYAVKIEDFSASSGFNFKIWGLFISRGQFYLAYLTALIRTNQEDYIAMYKRSETWHLFREINLYGSIEGR
jgi:hypothetical protein